MTRQILIAGSCGLVERARPPSLTATGYAVGGFDVAPPRTYDVARFVGNPSHALDRLDWRPTTPLSESLDRLITTFREEGSQ